MRLPLALALAAAALVSGGCSTSPCQRLGEKLCACTGLTTDLCTTQVQDQLKGANASIEAEQECQKVLFTCEAPTGTIFCEWLLTADGKKSCGLIPPPP